MGSEKSASDNSVNVDVPQGSTLVNGRVDESSTVKKGHRNGIGDKHDVCRNMLSGTIAILRPSS